MKITEILTRDRVISDLSSKNKKDVIFELVGVLPNAKTDGDRLVQVLLEREKLGSTGIGDGVAIPHGKMKNIGPLVASFGRSKEGVDFDSLDGKLTHLFFLLIAPEDSAGVHLKALARISRLFKDGNFRHALLVAQDSEEIFRIIHEEDEKYG
jgi:PTS system nitrogen regulatory IIA component